MRIFRIVKFYDSRFQLFFFFIFLICRQKSFSPDRKKYLASRRVVECVEFLTPPHSDKQFGGRSSGSLAWRISRGESRSRNKVSVEWKPNEIELQRKQ